MRKDRSSVLPELAIIVPVLAALVFGGTDLLMASMARASVQSVAQASAECTMTPGCKLQEDSKRSAAAVGLNPDFLTVNVQGNIVTVVYVYHLLGPISSWPQFTVTATSS